MIGFPSLRTLRSLLGLVLAAPLFGATVRAQTSGTPTGTVIGVVIDSVRDRLLSDAVVRLEPSGREAVTDEHGAFRLVNVRPGTYRLRVLHMMLDSLGIAVVTPEFQVATDTTRVPVAVPNAARVVLTVCPRNQLLRGPAMITGFVREPDTERPVAQARVTLLYSTNLDPTGTVKDQALRETRTDSTGRYLICGLPEALRGQLLVEKDGTSTGNVPVDGAGVVNLRGVTLAPANAAATSGHARLTGRVLNASGNPVDGARVTVTGTNSVAVTTRDGTFSLDSLPGGTRTVEVRKIGFSVTEKSVDLVSYAQTTVEVSLGETVTILAPVTSLAQRDQDLERVGYARRAKLGAGYFYEGDRVNTFGTSFSETLGQIPAIRVVREGDLDYHYVVKDRRDPQGCVNFVVDGNRWRTMKPGDIDEFVRPDEVQALEVYGAATVPVEFVAPGDGKCLTVVVWTSARIRPKRPGS